MFYWKNPLIILLLSISNLLAQDYLWPTDASKYLTSTFGEFRPRHFHAALDIKTWGQTGYKIFAIEDGYIYRIRVSSTGYGKAIYLKLRDGNFVIYAHLNNFIPSLEDYTDSLRLAARKNTLDTFLKRYQFPVKKGDLLGYTGDTGIGVPHLHFEIRDSKNYPINPLQFYRNVIQDDKPPLSYSLAIVPLNPMTLINFKPDTLILDLLPKQETKIPQPIYLTGKAYIALKSFDQANDVGNRFSFYKADLSVDDSLVYQVQYDRFSYAQTRLVELDKNYSLWRKGLGIFHNFYRHRFNRLWFYQNFPIESGVLSKSSLKEGINNIRVELYDFDGNHSEISLEIVYHRREQLKVFDLSKLSQTALVGLKSEVPIEKLEINFYDPGLTKKIRVTNFQLKLMNQFMDNYFYSLSFPLQKNPVFSLVEINSYDENSLPIIPLYIDLNETSTNASSDTFKILKTHLAGKWIAIETNTIPKILEKQNMDVAFTFQPDPFSNYTVINVDTLKNELNNEGVREFGEIYKWVQIIPGKSNSVVSPDRLVKVDFPAEAVYDTFFCRIDIENSHQNIANDYPMITSIYSIQPFDQVLNEGALLSFELPDTIKYKNDPQSPAGLGVYYRDKEKGWLYLPTNFNYETKTLHARITSLENFSIIKDNIPPQIFPINQGYNGIIYIKNSSLKIGVRDNMAGIYDQEQISVYIDNRWTLFRYDPEEDLVIIAPKHIPYGQHQLSISATDNVGNQLVKEFKISRQ